MARGKPHWGWFGTVPFAVLVSCGSVSKEDEAENLLLALSRSSGYPLIENQQKGPGHLESWSRTIYDIHDSHQISWIFSQPREEVGLLKLGKFAIPAIASVVGDPRASREIRIRLALLLGRIGDVSAQEVLFSVLDSRTTDVLLEDTCITALGLLKSPTSLNRLSRYLDNNRNQASVLWAMAMSGEKPAEGQFLSRVEAALANEEVEDLAPTLPVRKFNLFKGERHILLTAKNSEGLAMHIWRAGHFHSPRVLNIFIEALRYHDSHVQHMGLHLLQEHLDRCDWPGECSDFELHTLEVYSLWKHWREQRGADLQWEESSNKYRSKDSSK